MREKLRILPVIELCITPSLAGVRVFSLPSPWLSLQPWQRHAPPRTGRLLEHTPPCGLKHQPGRDDSRESQPRDADQRQLSSIITRSRGILQTSED